MRREGTRPGPGERAAWRALPCGQPRAPARPSLAGTDDVGVLEEEGEDVVVLDVRARGAGASGGGRRGRAEPEEETDVAVAHRGNMVAGAYAVVPVAIADLFSPARTHFAVGVVGRVGV